MKRFTTLSALFVFALVSLAASYAFATDETNDFQVTATVVASCSITAGDLAFGNYDPTEGSSVAGTSTISVTCSNGTGWDVFLNDGGSPQLFVNREMDTASPATPLEYNLYTEVGHTNIWNATTVKASGTGDGTQQDSTVYGLIASGQNTVAVGAYTDTITATITY